MIEKKQIDILLSTCNGRRFLAHQLDSLILQEYPEWNLIARDDGSQDDSIEILHAYRARTGRRITVAGSDSHQYGLNESMARLLCVATANYIMFCDQDDVWLPAKIGATFNKMRAVEKQHGANTPVLIHTDLTVVNKNLGVLSDSFWRYQHLDPRQGKMLNRIVVQNTATGCTIMINKALKDKIKTFPLHTIMYDWWLALAAAAFGIIDYLPLSTILYRQHEANSIGAKQWGAGYMVKMICTQQSEIKNSLHKTQLQAGAFLEMFRDGLLPQHARLLERYSLLDRQGFFGKRCTMIEQGFFKTGFVRNVGLLASI